MAISKIKATYSLDVETVHALEAMARRLGVSKSEALRRAIASAARVERSDRAGRSERIDPRLAALDRLQKRLALTPEAVEAWVEEARQLRRDSDRVARIWEGATPIRRVAEPGRRRRK
jgi:hypothetical protein